MRRGMRNPCGLKVISYAARLIDLKKYLALFSEANLAEKIGETELTKILFNSMPNSLSKQAYVKIFDCTSITFKKTVNIFEHMYIVEYIYEGVVEPYN